MKKLIYLSTILPLLAVANYNIDSVVWNDLNEDWSQSANEKGLPNITVELYRDNNGVKTKVGTTKTDANGHYVFEDIQENAYSVKVLPSANTKIVTENNLEFWIESERKDLNFGMYTSFAHSINAHVWNDLNEDWSQSANEKGLHNVTVELYSDNNGVKTKVGTTKTDANGKYTFDAFQEGAYTVKVLPSANTKMVTENNLEFWLEGERTDLNFGLHISSPYSINSYVWHDANKDWSRSSAERGIPNVEVELYSHINGVKTKIKTTKTDKDGNYAFSNLQEGSYITSVVPTADNSMITENNLELYLAGARTDLNFGMYDKGLASLITREELLDMIKKNEDVTQVNTSGIRDMSNMFSNATNFNQDISNWDVSNVTDMYRMFYRARYFNQDISKWNVSNVTNMRSMFSNATNFNQDISKWNVSNVTNMRSMFSGARNFNPDISKWDVSNVTDMNGMFAGATNFNQDISQWDVSNVTDMNGMFFGTTNFNQDISQWDVSNVTNMRFMFYNAKNFNQDISKWDVSNVSLHSSFSEGSILTPEHSPF